MGVKLPLPSPGDAALSSEQLWGQWPHTGRGELAQAPVPKPWHVPGLSPLVLALVWLQEQFQTRGNAALYLSFLLDSFNPGQDPCLVPCSHSHSCGMGTGGTKQGLGDKPECPQHQPLEHVPALVAWPVPFSPAQQPSCHPQAQTGKHGNPGTQRLLGDSPAPTDTWE